MSLFVDIDRMINDYNISPSFTRQNNFDFRFWILKIAHTHHNLYNIISTEWMSVTLHVTNIVICWSCHNH